MAKVHSEEWLLVPIVIANPKMIGTSLSALVDHIQNARSVPRGKGGNVGEWHFDQIVIHGSQEVVVKLRFCAPMRCPIPEAWTCSLIMHNVRIDGICHHIKAKDGRGGMCRGWHRHEWDANRRSCKELRRELPGFDPGSTVESFVSGCCSVLGVTFEHGEAASGGL